MVQISKEARCVINPRVPTSSSSSVPIILIVRGVCVCLCVCHVSIVQKERYRPLFFILLRAPHLFGKKRTSEVSPFSGCPGASPSSPLFQQHYTEERRLKEPRKYEADINFHLSRIQRVSLEDTLFRLLFRVILSQKSFPVRRSAANSFRKLDFN